MVCIQFAKSQLRFEVADRVAEASGFDSVRREQLGEFVDRERLAHRLRDMPPPGGIAAVGFGHIYIGQDSHA